jgi:adenylate cyclase
VPIKPKANILYVDDEANNLISFTAAFRRDYNIFTALSAREAVDILKRENIQLIVTDQRMPEMTGIQFLEAIIPEYPNAIRMILTGFSDVEAIIKAINTGRVYRYITKPWNEADLRTIIESGLALYQLEKRNRELIEELNDEIIKQKRVMTLFQKYVPEAVLNEILLSSSPESILSGESRVVSVLFSDIRNFTRIASKLDPSSTVNLLNDYYALMAKCVQEHQGSTNKFLGDGLLAVFGAPVSTLNNQLNAVFCGLKMLELLHDFNNRYFEKTGEEIVIGIGINTGEVIAGNVGSPERVEYSVLGDTVNVASRLQEMTTTMPNTLLISESTYNLVKDFVIAEKIGPIPIRGKDELFSIYKVTGKVIKVKKEPATKA